MINLTLLHVIIFGFGIYLIYELLKKYLPKTKDQELEEFREAVESVQLQWDVTIPLHHAVVNDSYEKVKVLLLQNVDVDERNNVGETALMIAASNNSLPLVKLLIEHDADVNVVPGGGGSPLYYALKADQELMEYLLKHGANVNVQDMWGMTPLYSATVNGDAEKVELLLKYKANPDIKMKKGWTPLAMAIGQERIDLVKLLLAHGANIENPVLGYRPLAWAARMGDIDIARLLLERGADRSALTHDKKTIIQVAQEFGHNDMANYLQEYKSS